MPPRRSARAAESDGLENRCASWVPWVQIPPPPLGAAEAHRTGRVRQEQQRQGRRLAGRTWPLPCGRKGVNRGTRTFDIRKITARPGQEGPGQGEDG